jgi:uncharacterized protein YjbI with pentapeptide repeats
MNMARRSAIVGVAVTCVIALGAQTAPAQEQEIGLLFAQTANRGTMKPIKGPTPRFNLRLYGVNPQVVWFSDRPARQSGQIAVPDFTRSWPGFGFIDDPPNAALTLLEAGNRRDTVVMELGHPDFKPKKNRVRYSAQLLDEATGNLSHLNSDLDPRVNRRFRSPSLFIDDATARVVGGCVIQPHTRCPAADLTGANLTVADPGAEAPLGADLTGADLTGAILRGVNLFRAELAGADLTGADLREANLSFANLSGASLRSADLTGAPLSGAVLDGADLTGANLSGTNLRGAHLCRTTLPDGSISNRDCP